MPITPLPPRPIPGSETFEAEAGALLDALPLFGDELNSLQTDVAALSGLAQTGANAASAAAALAAASANNAALSSGAVLWVSGTSYSLGARVISPANRHVYRRTTAAAVSTTDPRDDPLNWRADALDMPTGRPSALPSLMLPLRRARALDARVAFSRASSRRHIGRFGALEAAPANEWPLEHEPLTLQPVGRGVWEQRTNLFLHSGDLTDASWTPYESFVAASSVAAPDGTGTAFELVTGAGISSHTMYQNHTVTAGVAYTLSVFVKKKDYRFFGVSLNSAVRFGTTYTVYFDLDNGLIASGTASYLNARIERLEGGWFRVQCSTTAITDGSTTGPRISNAIPSGATGTVAFNGATNPGSSIIWGPQFEAGAFASPYIPTEASQVTRSADLATLPMAGLVRQGVGSLYAEFRRMNQVTAGSSPRVLTLHDGTANHRITMQLSRSGGASAFEVVMVSGGVEAARSTPLPIVLGEWVRVALAYRASDVALVVNGVEVWAASTADIPAGLATLTLGADSAGLNQLNGELGRVSYHPARLSVAECMALTAA